MASAVTRGVAIILGAGPGLGSSLAKKFAAKGLLVAAGSRSGATSAAMDGIKTYSVDAADATSVEAFVNAVESDLGPVSVAVYNVGGGSTFLMGSILTLSADDIERNWKLLCLGAFHFGQAVARRMEPRGSGTIMFTGATSSMRGAAKFAGLAIPKFGQRALAQCMARELGPSGIHVAHIIVDGLIDLESTSRMMGPPAVPDSRLSPDALADIYVSVHDQHRSTWTHELDVRPYSEKFS